MLDEYMSSDSISQGASDPLPVVAGKINANLDIAEKATENARQKRVSAGLLLIEARQRVEAGEAGVQMTWTWWLRDNIKRSEGDCRKVMRIAGAKDPHAEAERQRKAAATSMAKTRAERSNVGAVPEALVEH